MRQHWDPFADLGRLREEMTRAFSDAFGHGGVEPAQRAWTPPVDVWETPGEFYFAVALPGANPESIDVHVEGETLTIRGERKAEERHYHRQEILTGPFYRSFTLGVPVDNAKVEATYRNGILEVKVPKAEAAKPRKVQVQVA